MIKKGDIMVFIFKQHSREYIDDITKDMKIYIVGNINYTLKDGVEEAYTIIKK